MNQINKEDKELLYKALCGYLLYKLKVSIINNELGEIKKIDTLTGCQCFDEDEIWIYTPKNEWLIEEVKPILRPLSDLTKEITHNGKVITPIRELFKMIDKSDYVDWYHFLDVELDECLKAANTQIDDEWNFCLRLDHPKNGNENSLTLSVTSHNICLFDNLNCEEMRIMNERDLFEYLKSLHFDLDDLIEENLAIDINTLNTND
jgi:hypothetical protein